MSERVVILGTGGHGRGTLEILRARAEAGLAAPDVAGFVDDAFEGDTFAGLPVLGKSAWLEENTELPAILAIASARGKEALATRLAAAGVRFASAIHPSAILGTGTKVEAGAIVGAGVVVAYDTRIEAHTTLNLNATVGHDCVIGVYSTVAPGVNITGNVTLGPGVEIQTNATIVPGVNLGAFAQVGPGAVVLRDVGEGDFVFGNPARRMPRPGKGGA